MQSNKTVSIIFHDQAITRLFSALLNSLEIDNRVLNSPSEILESDLIITERKYYGLIKEFADKKCIIVGSDLPELSNAIALEQPLTEVKVMQAIDNLLS